MNNNIYFDDRWIGAGGIGKFAKMLNIQLNMIKLNMPGKPTNPWDPIVFALRLLFLPSNAVVITPGFNAPLFVRQKFILTLCDLNHVDRLENTSFLKRLYYEFIIKRAIKYSYRILTISEFTKLRIIDWSGVEPEKIINVSLGVDSIYNVFATPHLPGYPYFLCVSNRKKHKNEIRLIKAFSQSQIDSKINLLFTGKSNLEIDKLCSFLGISHRVHFLGRVSEKDLPGLYVGSLGLLFPSLYEGFGLPVIEAMACGVPVLTSNSTSLNEVAANAAQLVDPISVDEITSGIELLANDADLRNKLSAKGLERVKIFTWETVASKVSLLLNDINASQF